MLGLPPVNGITIRARPLETSVTTAVPGTSADELVEITSYAEVVEAFRSPKFAVVMDEASRPIRGGTVLRLDGEAHAKRRRLLNKIVLRGRHASLRAGVLGPALERELARIVARADEDGVARADLVPVCTLALLELVAAMIGLDAAKTTDGLDELVRIHADVVAFTFLQTQLRAAAPPLRDGAAGLDRAVARYDDAKRRFVERFYLPALAQRERLVARYRAGEIGEADLPTDLLTIVATHAEEAFEADPDQPVRHALVDLLHAGTGTSVGAVIHSVDELSRWWAAHPEDRALRADPVFLAGAVNETLRLHSANPAEVRRAVEDVTLSGGTSIRAGQYAALRTGAADRDPAVFGADADRFDPRRSLPAGTTPYGVAFGAGAHLCYGVPLALGDKVMDGNLVVMLRMLYEEGVEPDPRRSPRIRPAIAHADLKAFESYPVVFRRASAR
jgi:cytochrome P450